MLNRVQVYFFIKKLFFRIQANEILYSNAKPEFCGKQCGTPQDITFKVFKKFEHVFFKIHYNEMLYHVKLRCL